MIEAERLGMQYGPVQALSDASFTVDKGEIVGLLGPNGAGKSTLMKILTTFLYPTEGSARVGGKDVRTEPLAVRCNIGYLPEMLPLYKEMEAGEYLTFVGRGRGLSGKTLKGRLNWAVDRTGLAPMLRKPIRELSKGYKQRTALAQAIIHDPAVLILDEPTTGLDPHQILEIRQLIRDLARDKTIIFSTHILQEVEAIADRVVIISNGKIAARGTVDELAGKARDEAVVNAKLGTDFQTARPELEAIGAAKGVDLLESGEGWCSVRLRGEESAPMIQGVDQAARRNDWAIHELRETPVSLEEAFLALTRKERAQ